jgi:hypothetical protein
MSLNLGSGSVSCIDFDLIFDDLELYPRMFHKTHVLVFLFLNMIVYNFMDFPQFGNTQSVYIEDTLKKADKNNRNPKGNE